MINKVEICGVNTSELPLLSEKEKAEEVARLMGGVGEYALPNAIELINWAKNI